MCNHTIRQMVGSYLMPSQEIKCKEWEVLRNVVFKGPNLLWFCQLHLLHGFQTAEKKGRVFQDQIKSTSLMIYSDFILGFKAYTFHRLILFNPPNFFKLIRFIVHLNVIFFSWTKDNEGFLPQKLKCDTSCLISLTKCMWPLPQWAGSGSNNHPVLPGNNVHVFEGHLKT